MIGQSRYRVSLPIFEGPLDLLLSLIEREELEITRIALAQVTDQYLAHLAELGERRVSDLAAFLVVAAKLLLIKSQALLPRPPAQPPGEAAEVADDLVQQLREYRQFKEVALLLHGRQEQGLRSYLRVAARPRLEPRLDLGDVALYDLLAAAQRALHALPAPAVDQMVAPVSVTVGGQIRIIERFLDGQSRVRFDELLAAAGSRIEVIITLLALLELIKQDRVSVRQDRLFGDIIIERRRPAETANGAPVATPATA